MTPRPLVVLKFGGTSVSSPERWDTIAAEARARVAEGLRPVIVCSAVRGVSDRLDQLAALAPEARHSPLLAELREIHERLVDALGVSREVIAPWLDDLERIALGASLLGEASPRQRARLMSFGELVLTRIGEAALRARGLDPRWADARELLTSVDSPNTPEARRLLAARVSDDPDPALAATLAESGGDCVITQGFIARSRRGETVLLGRGGSDTSAALLAARSGAVRCEIWTDVPGMFSANPAQVPSARLLRHLGYDEAQELASAGAKVLHPACIAPVRRHRIPLEVRCTPHPEWERTHIGASDAEASAGVKALALRKGLMLITVETVGMWQQVGFLAGLFDVFREHGLSIDLVSTAETSVTVSLDPAANAVAPDALDALLADLGALGEARAIGPCASVSLVGQRIRSILHRLGPALEIFEEYPVYLVSQAASDLNLTFVVDEEHADRLVRDLHALLLADAGSDRVFGPSWSELSAGPIAPRAPIARWWERRASELLAAAAEGTPRYIYDAPTLDARAADMMSLGFDRVFYAMKANDAPPVLRRLIAAGIGVECVSAGELRHLRAVAPELPGDRVLFTPNFGDRADYALAFELGAHVNLDALHPLEAWPELFAGRDLLLRVDPGHGRGHHHHVRTAGARSKFGIAPHDLERAAALAASAGARVVGLHAHVGSGILDAGAWLDTALTLANVAERFPEARVLDLGGGFGVVERPGQSGLDLEALRESLARFRAGNPRFALWGEPGRFLVADAGVLLLRVTQTKRKEELRYVGCDGGMNALIRPALYGAWHEIANLSRLGQPAAEPVEVVGPVCESGDVIGHARPLPRTEVGDVLLVATAGAYGRVMASMYNRRELPVEALLEATPTEGPSR